jgi:putative membrane protein
MKNFIIQTIITAIAVIVVSYILPGVSVNRFTTALLVALVLSVLNFLVKPILVILTLPITIVTLGLFLFIINAVIIVLASKLVTGFRVDTIWWALLSSLLLSIFTSVLETIIEPDYKKKKN